MAATAQNQPMATGRSQIREAYKLVLANSDLSGAE
jgi:hypothetical protein